MADEHKQAIETLTTEISNVGSLVTKSKQDMDAKYAEMVQKFGGLATTEAVAAEVKTVADQYAALALQFQAANETMSDLQKQLSNPLFGTKKDAADKDRESAIELQRRAHLAKGGRDDEFVEKTDELVDGVTYRAVVRKLMGAGLKSRAEIMRNFTNDEQKAFDMASLDIGFFSPEMLGLEIDCNIECWSLVDLYGQESVSRSTFMYPKIEDYGAIGAYDCDAKCDAELGPEGNIRWLNGKTYDYRGVFCFQRKVLQEANYDLLGFMMRAAQRSYRINRNRVLMVGDGINEPEGWMTADCFTKVKTPTVKDAENNDLPSFNHQDWRRFLASAPLEYGEITSIMHQNVFAFLVSAVDANGRFIYGDGDMTFSPERVRERLRISNCLPDATAGGTLGSVAAPFVPGTFLAAAGNWKSAYKAVSKRPLWMQQYEGGSTAWCVKYVFGAEDGGFVGCCPAARTLVVG